MTYKSSVAVGGAATVEEIQDAFRDALIALAQGALP